MKLITETFENVTTIVEEKEGGKKNLYIEGVFLQADVKNRNNRIYERRVLEPAINKYVTEQVKTGRAVGELNHPDTPIINLDRVSHRIVKLEFNENNVVGKALVLETPMGNVVKGLIDGGVKVGVSSRGMGNLKQSGDAMMVEDGYYLSTVDIVQDPSAPSAFVNGIMEGKEWIWDNGIIKERVIEKYETEVKRSSNSRKAVSLRIWNDFLSKLSKL